MTQVNIAHTQITRKLDTDGKKSLTSLQFSLIRMPKNDVKDRKSTKI